MKSLRPTAIIVTAFLAGAALAEIGIRATGAFHHADRSRIEAMHHLGRRPVPVRPVRSTEPAPKRCPAIAI